MLYICSIIVMLSKETVNVLCNIFTSCLYCYILSERGMVATGCLVTDNAER